MPIGSDLNTTLPEVGDSPSTAASRIIDTFEKLITAVEGTVPMSVLTASGHIEMAGASGINDAAYLELADSVGISTTVGQLHRFDGNLYWISPAGTVQITDGAGLNAAATGGIGGDYGAGAEVLEYDATNFRYEAYDSPGDLSGLMGDRVVLQTGVGECTLTTNTATNVTWTFPAAPAADGLMQATTAGAISVSTTVAPRITFSILPNHPSNEISIPLVVYLATSGVAVQGATGILASGAATTFLVPLTGLSVGGRIKEIKARIQRGAAGTASVRLVQFGESAGAFFIETIGTASTSTTAGQIIDLDKTGLTQTIEARKSYFAQIILPVANDTLGGLTVVYDRAV